MMTRAVPHDRELAALDLTDPVREKLERLEIHTLRQLFARLAGDHRALREYLGLSERDFAALRQGVERRIQEESPEDALPRVYPRVHKRGVAAHRLGDSRRPRFHGDDD